jgi:hypothetical protein
LANQIKIAIGPLNTAHQATSWSNSLNRQGMDALTFIDNGVSHAEKDLTKVRIPDYRFTPTALRLIQIHRNLKDLTHILVESGSATFKNPRRKSIYDEMAYYEHLNVKVGVIFHGSDIRNPSLHIRNNPHSFCNLFENEMLRKLEERSKKNKMMIERMAIPAFVTTLDLLEDLPNAKWLPLILPLTKMGSDSQIRKKGKLRVGHLPSRSNPPIKGTKHIQAIEAKFGRNLEFVLPDKSRAHDEMRAFYNSVDIVIDQILCEAYGVTAIEAMACGRIVLSGGLDRLQRHIGEIAQPFIQSTPIDLIENLENILDNRSEAISISQNGKEFVENWHSGKNISKDLKSFLEM